MTERVFQRLSRWAAQREQSVGLLLALGSIFGLIFSLQRATWQVPVETAQVLMGLVPYEPSALPYAYNVSVFSLLNYVAWLFLELGGSEVVSSVLVGAVVGILGGQVLAAVMFAVVRNVYVAVALSVVLIGIGYFGAGISYPVLFIGGGGTYGSAGPMFALYAVLLVALGSVRLGAFCCGLALAVHPSWGIWLNLCVAVTLLSSYLRLKYLITLQNIGWYVTGVLISVALYKWQKVYFPIELPLSQAASDEAKSLFVSYVRYWDYHRQKFSAALPLAMGFGYSAVALALAAAATRINPMARDAAFFFRFVTVSALLSAVFVFVPSWFDPAGFPEFFITLMPGRFINLTIFLAIPLAVACLFAGLRARGSASSQVGAGLVLAAIWLAHLRGIEVPAWLMGGVGGVSAALALWLPFASGRQRINQASQRSTDAALLVALVGLIAIALPVFAYRATKIERSFARPEVPAQVRGAVMLTTRSNYLPQLTTRMSLVVDTRALDGYPYAGSASLLALDRLLKDIYGISLRDIPRTPHDGLSEEDHADLWRARTCEEWEALARKYGFGFIMTPPGMALRLERLDDDPAWNKYEPRCGQATPAVDQAPGRTPLSGRTR